MHTCKSLRLDIESATAGKTWLLLPEGFRDEDSGKSYPLPTHRREVQRLIAITIPPNKHDSGCYYLRRAVEAYRQRQARSQSALLDIGRRQEKAQARMEAYELQIKRLQQQAKDAVANVRAEADKAIASLNDLFSLGRAGLDGQMKAHLANEEWKGEKIDAEAFRQCFRLVSQAVKGLGLPSTERETARDAIIGEAAASLRATREAVAMAPSADDAKEH
jgi:hypothetical protein